MEESKEPNSSRRQRRADRHGKRKSSASQHSSKNAKRNSRQYKREGEDLDPSYESDREDYDVGDASPMVVAGNKAVHHNDELV